MHWMYVRGGAEEDILIGVTKCIENARTFWEDVGELGIKWGTQ